jgi:hypothetical protein
VLISLLSFVYENTVIYAAWIAGGLKEDATVEIPTTLTPTQLLLFWMLMGLLLTWMIVFALLALKPEPGKKREPDVPGRPASSFPQLHVIVQQQAEMSAAGIQLEPTPASASSINSSSKR